MSLLSVSLTGGVFILAVLLLRDVFQNIVPRRTFLVLWLVADTLLLIPFRVRLPVSIYALAPRPAAAVQSAAVQAAVTAQPAAVPWWKIVWICGGAVLLAIVLVAHVRNLLRFRGAVPVEPHPAQVPSWVRVKALPGLSSPLAYGIFRPVILIPSEDFASPEQLRHVYLHELCHIRHLDVARRYLMLIALAVHWFNPLVWVMYYIAAQDMEMRCDEQAIRQLGAKKPYAATLVALETGKLQHLLDAGFSFSSTGSRLKAILNAKRLPVISAALALILCAVAFAVFATDASAQQSAKTAQASAVRQIAPDASQPESVPEPTPEPERVPEPESAPEPETTPEPEPEPEPEQSDFQEEFLPPSTSQPAQTSPRPAPQPADTTPSAPTPESTEPNQPENSAADLPEVTLPPAIPESEADPVFTPIGTLDTTPPTVPYEPPEP